MPEKLQIKVIPQTGKQYRQVESLLERQDIGSVVIATDAGREGELVARWILQKGRLPDAFKEAVDIFCDR